MFQAKPIISASLLLFALIQSHAQCLLLPTSIEQRVDESDIIVEGKVIDQYSFYGEERFMIYTANVIEVYKSFLGTASSTTIEVVSVGGQVDDYEIQANPSLKLQIGQEGIFMAKEYEGRYINNGQSTVWVGVAEGASIIPYNPITEQVKDIFGETFNSKSELYAAIKNYTDQDFDIIQRRPNKVTDRSMMPSITSFTPTTATAGTQTSITITGSGFGATAGTVFFDAADDGSGGSFTGSSSGHIVSWSDMSIEVWVPSGAGTGNIFVRDNGGTSGGVSSQTLTVPYNLSNSGVNRTYLIDDMCDGDGGYTFVYMTNTSNGGVDFTAEDGGNAQGAFERAISTWQANGYAIYAGSGCGTTTAQVPLHSNGMGGLDDDDGVVMVGFDNNLWDLDTEASSSTLGVCYTANSACSGGMISTNREIVEFDIIFRRDGDPNMTGGSVAWEYGGSDGSGTPSGGESDFESVALHELGHSHQLGHIINSGEVMHFSITTGTSNRSLGTSEVDGGNDVESESAAYAPPLIGCSGDFSCSRQYTVYNAAEDCGALPVSLITFNGHLKGEHVELHWQTASEQNNDYFLIERSIDGRNFEDLGTVDGRGTTTEAQYYNLLDTKPAIGTNYYRLTQFDYDGTFEVFQKIVAVDYKGTNQLTLRPNPIRSGALQITYESIQAGPVEVSVFNTVGQQLHQQQFDLATDLNQFELPIDALSPGVYLLQLRQGNTAISRRFVKAK